MGGGWSCFGPNVQATGGCSDASPQGQLLACSVTSGVPSSSGQCGVRAAWPEAAARANQSVHGCSRPAAIFALTKSSCARDSSAPGWTKVRPPAAESESEPSAAALALAPSPPAPARASAAAESSASSAVAAARIGRSLRQ